MTNLQLYNRRAFEACEYIFEQEYFNGLGIPLPEIKFIEPDSHNFETGEYYIRIGETWQIHLNFGSLPKDIFDFAEEVKVLTRHEVEHYKTCPFDVITHFRMLNTIVREYENQFPDLNVDIKTLAPQLANQISDIIIDTHNFRRYPKETLKSEIAWIKKGSSKPFNELPGYSKLLFLTKARLWDADLELNETNENLLSKVKELALVIDAGGITSPNRFLEKTAKYCSLFFELYRNNLQKAPDTGELKSPDGSIQGQQNILPQLLPSKDSQQEGNTFIFSTPDNIKSAIEQFAHETDLKHFQQILSAAGIKNLSEIEKRRIWFNAQDVSDISIPAYVNKGSNDNYSYPDVWKIGDPIEELDLMLSFSISPKLIPGITTKKWSKNNVYSQSADKISTDLMLILDSSGSMGKLDNNQSKLFNSVLSCFAITNYFEKINAEISLINFASKPLVTNWTKHYDLIKDGLLFDGQGSTIFPFKEMSELAKAKRQAIAIVIITDGEISRHEDVFLHLKQQLLLGNKVFMFLSGKKTTVDHFAKLRNYGAVVSQAHNADEIRSSVLSTFT